jgi:hypothetical protein
MGDELEIYDRVERRITRFEVEGWLPTESSYEFRFPVDESFSGRCRRLAFKAFLTFIRKKRDYEIIARTESGAKRNLPRDEYIIEVDAHAKIYIYVNSSIVLECAGDNISLAFDADAELVFGVRSFHRRPEATIHTTKELYDLARAISLLSSSIKIENCERSYPSLRGHPPLIEFSDEFYAPLKKRDSGVEIFIPRKLHYLYIVSPLAYYLLADIKFGEPGIKCEGGYERPLSKLPRFQDEISEILQRVFFIDCLVRNAGLYKLELYELRSLENQGLDINELYHMRIDEQLPIYLEVPMEKLRPFMPVWHLSSYVEPKFEKAKALPFLLNNLSTIYLPRSRRISPSDVVKLSLNDIFRGNVLRETVEKSISKPVLKKAQSHLWLVNNKPIDVAKVDLEAFYNQFKYNAEKKHIDVALVLNDEKMLEEKEKVREIYAQRKEAPLTTRVFDFVGTDELARIFQEGYDLVHFIGHCEERGLICNDGFLKAEEIPENNTPAFFLNACKSYEEGIALIRKGSVGGLVTLYYVPNAEALKIGYTFTRLLSIGYSIGEAIKLASKGTISGRDYLVLGNEGYQAVQGEINISMVYEIARVDKDHFLLKFKSSWPGNIGGYVSLFLQGNPHHYLLFNQHTIRLSHHQLEKFLEQLETNTPVIYNKKLHWSHEFHLRKKRKKWAVLRS